MRKATALAIVVLLAGAACATLSPQYSVGVKAELNKNWEDAIAAYERAALENPKEAVYRLALERTRVSASFSYFQEARKLVAQGKREEAKLVFAKALEFNPTNAQIAYEAKLAAEPAPTAPAAPVKLEFPIKLKVKEGPLDLRFPTGADLRSILTALGRSAGINVVFDEGFREIPFQADMTGVTFEQALKSICQATRNFYRILDEKTVIVVQDQPLKRMQYEVNAIRVFYISNVSAQELQATLTQMLRGQVKAPIIYFDKNLNSIIIRDTPQVLDLAERLIRVLDKPRAEVVIDVEIMEVSRTKLRQLGISFDQNVLGVRYGAAAGSTDSAAATTTSWFNLKGIDLSKAENYSVSLPLAYLQFLESDADTKMVAKPRLRGVSDEELRQLVGQKVPIPKTSFQVFAAGGYPTQPITNYDFQDVGLDVKLTPKVHTEKEVTLTMEIKVTSLGGKGYADIPVINTRELKGVMRLRDGETNLIAGLLRDEERQSLKGIPGLKDIPGLGRLFGAEDTTLEQTDVIMTITPYIIRSIPVTAEDAKALWIDVDVTTAARGDAAFDAELLDREVEAAVGRPVPVQPGQAAGANSVGFSPAVIEAPVGREFRMAVSVRNEGELGTMSMTINYNPQILTLKSVAEGGLTRQLGDRIPFLQNIDQNSGVCTLGFSAPQAGRGIRGGGVLATLLFEPKAAGEAVVAVTNCAAAGPAGQPLMFQPGEARVTVR